MNKLLYIALAGLIILSSCEKSSLFNSGSQDNRLLGEWQLDSVVNQNYFQGNPGFKWTRTYLPSDIFQKKFIFRKDGKVELHTMTGEDYDNWPSIREYKVRDRLLSVDWEFEDGIFEVLTKKQMVIKIVDMSLACPGHPSMVQGVERFHFHRPDTEPDDPAER